MADLANCIRANGVPKVPDPTFSEGGVEITGGGEATSRQLHAAQQACKSKMPSGGGPG